ncbi:MAG: STAS domain-containing protein [Candidatus Gracilibacteria bacterium]|jgi:anti-anti-sigma factor
MQKTLNIVVNPLDATKRSQLIQFNGDFDKAGYGEVRDELNGAVKSFVGASLVFDFTNLKFINSEGIGYLMEVHTHLVKQNKKLVIVGVNEHVKDVFETIGISEVIPLYPTLDAFLKA